MRGYCAKFPIDIGILRFLPVWQNGENYYFFCGLVVFLRAHPLPVV